MERAVPASEPSADAMRSTVAAENDDQAPSPAPIAIVDLARARLARELRSLPPWGSPALRARLLAPPTPRERPGAAQADDGSPSEAPEQPSSVSSGALVHAIRRAQRLGATQLTADLFVALLERIEGVSRQWARRAVASARVDAADASAVREDLRQELTLRLWEHIGRGDGEAWELFFQRALAFEQRHVATLFLTRQGYQHNPRSQTPARGASILLSRLTSVGAGETAPTRTPASSLRAAIGLHNNGSSLDPAEIADAHDDFTAADLADLRWLVARLPNRERFAVTLRFWYGASEAEISAALGGVSTRTVRNVLARAYARLRGEYQPDHAVTNQRIQPNHHGAEEAHS